MKKIIFLLSLFAISLPVFSQYQTKQTIGGTNTLVESRGGLTSAGGFINSFFADTTSANASPISHYPYAQIVAGGKMFLRNSSASGWTEVGSGGNTDSLSLWLSAKTDSLKLGTGITEDTLFEYRGGIPIIRGYIDKNTGVISGGGVSWAGTGLTFNVAPTVYRINGIRYSYPGGQITLSPSDPSQPRFDVIYLDTSGRIKALAGVANPQPYIPPLSSSAIPLTSVLLNPGDTTPSTIKTVIIYDENNEWATSNDDGTVDFNSTIAPVHGTRNIHAITTPIGGYVSLKFSGGPTLFSQFDNLTFYIKANLPTTDIFVGFYQGSTNVAGTYVTLGTINQYTQITIPMATLTKYVTSATSFNKIGILYHGDNSAVVDVDYLTLQAGTVGNQTSGTSGVTAVIKKQDSVFYTKEGVDYFAFKDSTGDFSNYYTRTQSDSINSLYAIKDISWSVLDSAYQPKSTNSGDRYLVSPSPVGVFANHANQIATYDTTGGTGTWVFQSASTGDLLYNSANYNTYKWTGTVWQLRPPLAVNNWWRGSLPGWGVGQFAATTSTSWPMLSFFGNSSIGIGYQVFNDARTPGSDNIAIGHVSQDHGLGSRNISMGTYSLWYDVSGHDQVAIGYGAAGTGNQVYSIGFGTNVKNVSKQFSISDSTNAMYFKLKTPTGSDTIPDYIVGRKSNGQWYSYPSSGSGFIGGSYIPTSEKGAVNGVATLNASGKVPNSQLPALTVNQPSYVQTVSAMLALSSAVGDIVVVGDSSKSYALMAIPGSTFSNWLELQSPVPTNTDLLPEGTTNKYYTDVRSRSAISAGSGITYNSSTGVISKVKPDWAATAGADAEILNKPVIPDQLLPIGSNTISITGTYPNLAWDTKNIYDKVQSDSISSQLRTEIQVAANGGVTLNQVDSANNVVRGQLADTSVLLRSLIPNITQSQINLWTNKQDQLNGTGFVKANGSTITYDNSTYATQLALNDTASALRAIAGSGGDMFKSVYDPTNISGDAFNYNNLYNTPNLTLKLNISDTSTMLSKYLRKVDTTGKWLSASYTPSWGSITSKPTTLSGYGITDAVNTTGTQTVAGTKTFSASMIYFNNIHGLNRVSLGNGTFESFSLFSDPTNSIFGIGANAYHDPTTNTYIVPVKFAYGGHGATIEASPTTGIRAMSVDSNGVATRLISVDTSGTLNLPKLKSGVSGQDFLRIDVNNNVFRNTQSEVITHLGISAKMNYTDTSAMLSPLWNKINSQTTDTVTANTPLHIVLNQSTNKQTLYVDTASATKDGALLKEDWSTFNGKQNQILLTTNGTSGAATLTGSTLNIPQYSGGTGGVTNLALGTATTTTQLITNSNGTGFTLTAATTLKAGLLSSDTQTIAGNKIFNGSVTLKSAADDGAALDKILQVDPTGIIKSNTFSDFQYKIGVNDRPKFTDSVTAIQTGTMTPTMLASLNGKQDKLIAITNQSNNYTLVLSDANTLVRAGTSTATTITVPTNATVAYPIGTQINVVQASTAQVTFAGASGVTINSAGGALKTRVQFSTVTLVKTTTDTWLLFGDITN